MRKRILFILVFTLSFSFVKAANFERLPHTITQPDGQTINCFVSGDEFFNWIHDEEGYTIIQASNGYYYYAVQNEDYVKPGKYKVNSINPASVKLSKWVKISKKAYLLKRDAMFSFEKKDKTTPNRAPHTGTLNNIVVYIRFSDDAEFNANRQYFDNKFNPASGVSLKSYYKEVSYDNLTISSSHYPACALTTNLSYQNTHSRNYFQPYNATTNPSGYVDDTDKRVREHQLLAMAIAWINANSAIPTSLNIDGDGDDNVDNVCFIIKGSNGGWNDLLWAHRWALYSQNVYINGKRVYDYTFQPESQVGVTTLCHEMFHALGAPDLYHYSQDGFSPVGNWDLMESGGGHMLTYMKWKYSDHYWISSIPEITTSGTYTLNPVTSSVNNCYKIASPNSIYEYFMVEYRNKSGTFETNIPGSGLIVYRINTFETGNANGPPDEVYVYRPNGTTTVNGNSNNAYFSSSVGRTAINDTTNPSGFLQNGNAGGLNISNITAAGSSISFDVSLPCTQPTNQASSFTVSASTDSSMTVGWTRGNGNSVIVVAKAGSTVNTSPTSGTSYNANAAFGSGSEIGNGNFVVYKGSASSVNLTSLTSGITYYFAVYEFDTTYNCYKIPALPGTVTVCNPPSIQASSFTSSSINNTLTIGWTRGNGTAGVIVVGKIGNPVNADPISGTSYSANAAHGSGSQIGTGNYVIYKGTGTSVTTTALLAGVTYHYAIYEYNSSSICYKTPSLTGNAVVCTPPGAQATSFTTSAITDNSITSGWTRGNGNAVLVVARADSAVNADPVSGTVYTANAVFGNGTEIGSGNYAVYKGNGTSFKLTGLAPETNYHFAVYEYANSGNCFKKPALTGNAKTEVLGIRENSSNLFNVHVYPNPFNTKTSIEYTLTENNDVELAVLDITGQVLINLFNGKQNKGLQKLVLDVSKLSSGIYFYRLKIGLNQQKGKLIRY
jgi:M6 family metalloprotease-like protein